MIILVQYWIVPCTDTILPYTDWKYDPVHTTLSTYFNYTKFIEADCYFLLRFYGIMIRLIAVM